MTTFTDFFSNFWDIFTTQELASMTGLQVVILAGVTFGFYRVLKYVFASAKEGTKVIVKVANSGLHFNKLRASKVTCIHCGRTLDKCVCPSNKNVGFASRISKQKKEQKLLRKLGKTK